MSLKLIAIGNVLMKDDAIGIKVAEEIEIELLKLGVNVIYGETNIQHCISSVEKDDYIIILDSAYYGKSIGEITIEDIEKNKDNVEFWNEHVITMQKFFENYPIIDLQESKLNLFLNGVQLTNNKPDGLYQIKVNDDIIGIGKIRNNLLKREIMY